MGQGGMTMDTYAVGRYREACALLPEGLRAEALALPELVQGTAEELRLRTGSPLTCATPSGERPAGKRVVSPWDLEQVLDVVTGYSRYTAAETLRQGYLTARGGFRVGLCGSAVVEDGEVRTLTAFSSLSIRIPREQVGVALPLLKQLTEDGRPCSTLILGPPGEGKTTLLRDMIRLLSDRMGLRVALADERGEIAAMYRGTPQLQVGRHTDVMDACPKALAIPALLRAMNPQVIAVDEVALPADVEAMERASHTGTALLATVHARTPDDLRRRPLLSSMMELGIFQRTVIIERAEGGRRYRVEAS